MNAYIEGALEPLELEGNPDPIEPLAAGIVANGHGTNGTTILNCTFSGYVEGYDAAGIVGQNNSGRAEACVNKGAVSAVRYAGGIAARMVYGRSVELSTNEGPVASSIAAGGIVGLHGNSGSGAGDIMYCASTGPVYGEKYSGAIAGYMERRTVAFEYDKNYYWLNGTGADVFPEGQVGNAKTTLGGSEKELETLPVEANKVDTLAEMPPTTVIFDYSDAPFGRREDQKTNYTRTPGRYIYPNDEGVYLHRPGNSLSDGHRRGGKSDHIEQKYKRNIAQKPDEGRILESLRGLHDERPGEPCPRDGRLCRRQQYVRRIRLRATEAGHLPPDAVHRENSPLAFCRAIRRDAQDRRDRGPDRRIRPRYDAAVRPRAEVELRQ